MSQTGVGSEGAGAKICVLIPIFNDWSAVQALLPLLDVTLRQAGRRVDVLILGNGSTTPWRDRLASMSFDAIETLRILELEEI